MSQVASKKCNSNKTITAQTNKKIVRVLAGSLLKKLPGCGPGCVFQRTTASVPIDLLHILWATYYGNLKLML